MKTLAKILIRLLIAGALIVTALEGALHFISFNQYQHIFKTAILQKFGLKATINGNIKYSILPSPHFEVQDVTLTTRDNTILAKISTVDLYSGILSLPTDIENMQPNTIVLDQGTFHYANIISFLKQNKIEKTNKLTSFIILNSTIELQTAKIENIYLKFEQNGWFTNGMYVHSKFEFQHHPFNLQATLQPNTPHNASIKLYDDAAEINLIGKIIPDLDNPQFSGNITGKITDMDNFSKKILNILNITTTLSKKHLILTGTIELNKNLMQIKDAVLQDDTLSQATLNAKMNFYKGAESEINITIEDMNLDNLLGLQGNNTMLSNELEEGIGYLIRWFNIGIMSDWFILFDLKINHIVLNAQTISNFIFNFDSFDGDLSLNTLEFNLPGKSGFKLNGVVTYNNIRPKFLGSAEFISDDFPGLLSWLGIDKNYKKLYSFNHLIMTSNVELMPYYLQWRDIKASLNDLLFIGSSDIRAQGASLLFGIKTRFNDINGDDFGLNTKIQNIITDLFISDHDKTGDLYSKLTDNFRWLRTFNENINYDIAIDHFTLNHYLYNDFNLSLALSPGVLQVNQIAASSKYTDFNGKFTLTLPSFEPYISLQIDCDLFDSKFMQYVLPPKIYLEKALYQYFKREEENHLRSQIEGTGDDAIITGFNFFGLNNNNGDYHISIDHLIYDSLQADNVVIKGVFDSGIIATEAKAKIFNGDAIMTSELAILSIVPSVSLALAFVNVDPGQLIGAISGLNNMSGYLSASTTLNTNGINWPVMVSNLNGNAEVLAKKVNISGFDLGQLINIPALTTSYQDKLERIHYYTQYGSTLFDQIKGHIKIQNGIVTLEDFILENNRSAGGFAAKYEIYNNTINAISQFSFIPTNTALQITLGFASEGNMLKLKTSPELKQYLSYVKTNSETIQADTIVRNRPTNKQDLLENIIGQ